MDKIHKESHFFLYAFYAIMAGFKLRKDSLKDSTKNAESSKKVNNELCGGGAE